uniref:Uncharacterized protein n=1 Tax=Ascaris lumbricoides TaxID=6252 RepID=A0A0M3IDQ2_ASCLU
MRADGNYQFLREARAHGSLLMSNGSSGAFRRWQRLCSGGPAASGSPMPSSLRLHIWAKAGVPQYEQHQYLKLSA